MFFRWRFDFRAAIIAGGVYRVRSISGLAGAGWDGGHHAAAAGKWNFFRRRRWTTDSVRGAWVTMMFGSIPSGMCFSAARRRGMRTAVRDRCSAGSLYFSFRSLPMFLACSATLPVDPPQIGGCWAVATHSPEPVCSRRRRGTDHFFNALLSRDHGCSSAHVARRLWPSVKISWGSCRRSATGLLAVKCGLVLGRVCHARIANLPSIPEASIF